VRLGETLHALVGLVVQDEGEGKGIGDGLVGYVVVSVAVLVSRGDARGIRGASVRWANAAACDDEVIVIAHARDGFDDLVLVVGNDFDALKVLESLSLCHPILKF
jgi:hypothetical protein